MTETAYIFDAIRTPRSKGKADGTLHEVKPIALVTTLLEEMRRRHDLDTARVDDVMLGCVAPVMEQGAVLPKIALQKAGWDESVPGAQLNRFCASGLDTFNTAAAKIASGWEDLVCAGGFESMSRVPMGADGGPFAEDPETSIDTGFVPQGIGADLIATIEGWNRDDVDEFALQSQKKAAQARDSGWFDRSVVPVRDENGLTILGCDDFIKPDTDMQKLGALKPSFAMPGSSGFDAVALAKYPEVARIDHVHTPGNSSGIVDGASLILVGNERTGRDLGLDPRGRVVAIALTATDPTIMLTGPGPASEKALRKAGLTIDDIDLVEINEAFASVALRLQRDLDVPDEKLNVVGGAIAMGHPLGATGGCLVSTLPISILAEACPDPSRFIGLHFFSPVERMKVVEIIMGEKTSQDTLRRAYDYAQQLGYMPIVVNDSRGFFTSRVFGTYLDEGLQLLQDGMSPTAIERAAWKAGMPVGPFAVFDEVSLILGQKVRQTHAALDARLGVDSGFGMHNTATHAIIDRMIAIGRGGRHYGGGFYEYAADGSKTLWPGLGQFARGRTQVGMEDAIDRLLYRQAIETLRCLDEGVLMTEVEANLGGILAIGFPAHTGGAVQFIRGIGMDRFAARAQDLAARYGARFAVADSTFDRLRDTGAQAA